jgi:hypothetical protein
MGKISRVIWDLSEWSGIGLGFLAPHIFQSMIGSKKKKKVV